MKLSLGDYATAANSRVLEGVITELNAESNTADVTISGTEIKGIPIHYWCHHGADDHAASRVFMQGDIVSLLYTGLGDQLSASNLTVFGLKDEIRRCREVSGLFPTFADADLWCLLHDTAKLQTVSIAAGNEFWSDGTNLISWSTSKYCKYASHKYGSTTTDIFMGGIVVATAPESFYGAGLRCEGSSKYLYIAGISGNIRRKKIMAGATEWSIVGQFYPTPTSAVIFNASCTKFCFAAAPSIYETNIDSNATTQLATEDNAPDGSSYTLPFAADYIGDTISIASYNSSRCVTTVYDGGNITGSHNDWYLSGTVTTVTTVSDTVQFMGHTYQIYDYAVSTVVSSTVFSKEYDAPAIGNGWNELSEVTTKTESARSISVPLWLDLVYEKILTWNVDVSGCSATKTVTNIWDADRTMIVDTNETYLQQGPANVLKKIELNGDILHSESMPITFLEGSWPPAITAGGNSLQYFDPVQWVVGKQFLIGVEATLKKPMGLINNNVHRVVAARHPVTGDSFLHTRLIADEYYTNFSGGSIESLTGKTPPLIVDKLWVI